jgi:type IV pilus assembly protein PilX
MKRSSSPRARQSGAILMIVVMLLLAMALLTIASLRSILMEQRMSANSYDRNISFQAAESGLRQGEALLEAGGFTVPASGCNGGFCAKPIAGAGTKDRWLDSSFSGWRAGNAVSDISGTPQYFIELMGPAANWPGCDQELPVNPNCLTPRYRVTARNSDPALTPARASIILQSNYAAATP